MSVAYLLLFIAFTVFLGTTALQSSTKDNRDTSLQRALVKYQTKLCFSASSVLLKEIITSAATEFDLHTETSLLVS